MFLAPCNYICSGIIEIDSEQFNVLKAAWMDDFEQLTDADYDPIREKAKRVDMPPSQ